jgi:hypothetical protein
VLIHFHPSTLTIAGWGVIAAILSLSVTAGGAKPPSPEQLLKSDALRTLAQGSFTGRASVGDHSVGTIVYQAPDRATSQSGQMIVVGRTLYEARTLTQSGTVVEWGRTNLSWLTNRVSGPMAAKAQLGYLLNASSVTAAANGYDFQETISLAQLAPGSNGEALMTGTASISQKLVRRISLTYAIGGVKTGAGYSYVYSSFNRSPRVLPPPASKTVTLTPCIDPKTHQPSPGLTCGVAG